MPSKDIEALDAYPIHLSQKHSFDFLSQKQLPESYTWPDQEPSDGCPKSGEVSDSIPVIDLQNPNACEQIGHACRTWGVFQVVNHGVPLNLLTEVEGLCKKLFSLPLEKKLEAARSADDVSGYGVSHISPFFSKQMWYEGFTVTGPPVKHARRLWPQNYTEFCDVIMEYREEMKQLGGKLLWLMLNSLGIHKKDEIKWASEEPDLVLQLNSYPICPDPDRAMGLAAHTDSSILTILYQDQAGGLQVLREGTGWLTVPPIPGALIVNLGDLSNILSNGLHHSVMHRAFPNKTTDRLSLAFFYGPPGSAPISPLMTTVDNPAIYRTVTWKEYLGIKGKVFNKALSCVKLSAPAN